MAYTEIFGRKDIGLRQATQLFISNLASDLRYACRESRLISTLGQATQFRFAQFAGAYLGQRTNSGDSVEVVRRMYYPRAK